MRITRYHLISLLCRNKRWKAYTWAEQEGQKEKKKAAANQPTNQPKEAQEPLDLVNFQPETIVLWFSTQNEFDSGCNNWQCWNQNILAVVNWPGLTDTTWESILMFYRNMGLDKEGINLSYSGFILWSKKVNPQLPGYTRDFQIFLAIVKYLVLKGIK